MSTTPHHSPLVHGSIAVYIRRGDTHPHRSIYNAVANAPAGTPVLIRVGSTRPHPFGDVSCLRRMGPIEVEAADAQTLAGWLEHLEQGLVDAVRTESGARGWTSGTR